MIVYYYYYYNIYDQNINCKLLLIIKISINTLLLFKYNNLYIFYDILI